MLYPFFYNFRLIKNFIELFDEGNNLSHVNRSVVKSNADRKNFSYTDFLFTVNDLNNRLFLNGTKTDNADLRGNDFKQRNTASLSEIKRADI